jgi:hypothetical protein
MKNRRVIDLRVRPPYGEFLRLHIFADGSEKSVTHMGHAPARSYLERSMSVFLEEMD